MTMISNITLMIMIYNDHWGSISFVQFRTDWLSYTIMTLRASLQSDANNHARKYVLYFQEHLETSFWSSKLMVMKGMIKMIMTGELFCAFITIFDIMDDYLLHHCMIIRFIIISIKTMTMPNLVILARIPAHAPPLVRHNLLIWFSTATIIMMMMMMMPPSYYTIVILSNCQFQALSSNVIDHNLYIFLHYPSHRQTHQTAEELALIYDL